jgi:hypothetical protein
MRRHLDLLAIGLGGCRLGLRAFDLGFVEEQVLLVRGADFASKSWRLKRLSCSLSRSRSVRTTRSSPASSSPRAWDSSSAWRSAAISSRLGMPVIGAHSLHRAGGCAPDPRISP